VFSLCITWQCFAQTVTVKGRAVNEQTKAPLSDVTVIIKNTETNSIIHFIFSDASGRFKMAIAPGDYNITPGDYIISFTSDGVEYFSQPIKVSEEGLDLGDVLLKAKTFIKPVINNIEKTTPTNSTIVSGRVIDDQTKNPISGTTVNIQNFETKTDEQGKFEISVISGDYVITISSDEWASYSSLIKVPAGSLDLGDLSLKPKSSAISEGNGIAEISLSDADVDNDKSSQNVSGLLHSSDDAFISAASFALSSGRFRVRGYDGENFLMFMNGLPLNDAENGRASYSEWGGLNNVTRNKDSRNGIAPSKYSLGTIGGETNINVCAGQIRKQNNFSYALANKSYNNRIMYTYSTGMQENGWAFVLSGSKRWAVNGYAEGTWYDAYSYFAGTEKKLSDNHSIALTFMGSPYKRAMQAGAIQEAYDLTGTHYYNPNWGYQDGEKRNAKVRNVHQPSILLTDNFKFNEKTKLTTSIGYSFGRFGTTALNWYNTNDPRPDYYRYFPSYQIADTSVHSEIPAMMAENWKTDPSVSQINWDKLYQTNYLANGAGQSARYVVEEQRKDNQQASFHTILNHELNENISLNGGLMIMHSNTHYFKVMSDLLGANYWLDVDQFAERDFPSDTNAMQNDLNNPNRHILVGDKFGYDYNINYTQELLWGLSQFKYNKVEFYIGLQLSNSSFYREGNMMNGRYPTNSYGKSEKINSINYLTKGGLTYKLSGHHYFEANVTYYTKSPLPENSFLTPHVGNRLLTNLENEVVYGGELSYIHKGEFINARITAYETSFNNQTDVKSYYDDSYHSFVQLALQGIDKIHQGIEFGADVKVTKEISANCALNIGNYRFTSRPTETLSAENGSVPDQIYTVYQKYFFVPGPQNAGTVGLKYNNSKYWFASANLNYFDKMYLDFAASPRTEYAMQTLGVGLGDPAIKQVTEQVRLDGGYTLDLSIGKSWKIKEYYIGINLNVNNVLNNQDLITGGYEQLRFSYSIEDLDKFLPKYYYGYGRTFFLMLSFRF